MLGVGRGAPHRELIPASVLSLEPKYVVFDEHRITVVLRGGHEHLALIAFEDDDEVQEKDMKGMERLVPGLWVFER
jgi:hypothetical protein